MVAVWPVLPLLPDVAEVMVRAQEDLRAPGASFLGDVEHWQQDRPLCGTDPSVAVAACQRQDLGAEARDRAAVATGAARATAVASKSVPVGIEAVVAVVAGVDLAQQGLAVAWAAPRGEPWRALAHWVPARRSWVAARGAGP